MKVCILADLQETVLSFGFRQNRLSGFVAVGGRNLTFPMDFTKLMEKRPSQCERANFDLTAELLFISSRQYLVMEYSIVLSVTHVYQVCLVSDIAIFVLKRDVKLQPDVSCY